jgi:hypothetical protein
MTNVATGERQYIGSQPQTADDDEILCVSVTKLLGLSV